MSPDYRNLHMSKQLPRKTKNESYNDLRYAIVIQAVKDYVWAREYVRNRKKEYNQFMDMYPDKTNVPNSVKHRIRTYEIAQWMVPECEMFFRSWWFESLAPDYNGEEVIKRLRRTSSKVLKQRLNNVIKEEEEC